MKWGVRNEKRKTAINNYVNKVDAKLNAKSKNIYGDRVRKELAKQDRIYAKGNTKAMKRYLDSSSKKVAKYNTILQGNSKEASMWRNDYVLRGSKHAGKQVVRSLARSKVAGVKGQAYRDSGEAFAKRLMSNGYEVTGVSKPKYSQYYNLRGTDYSRIAMVGDHTVKKK